MNQRISVGTDKAIALWKRNKALTIYRAARLAGVAHTTLSRAIKRLNLKRQK